MAKKLFVGNISWNIDDNQLKEFFSPLGEVVEAFVLKDKMTGRSRGFGFVVYADDSVADEAIAQLNGKELDGRAIVVNEARDPKRD